MTARVWTVQEFAEAGYALLQSYSHSFMAPDPPPSGRHLGGVMYPAYLRKELLILCGNVAIGAGRLLPREFNIKVTLDVDEKTLHVDHYLAGRLLREVPDIFEALTGS